MANTTKKPKKILKKQVRRTLGAICAASAIVVAAIPAGSYRGGEAGAAVIPADDGSYTFTHTVKTGYYETGNTSAHNEVYGVSTYTGLSSSFVETATAKTFYSDGANIPECDTGVTGTVPNTTIYSTGDGDFQFAYVDSSGSQTGGGTKTAVILGYNHQGALAGGELTIPDTVDAYLNFNDNDGSSSGFCAVGKSGNFLFYETDITYNTNASTYYYVIPNGEAKTDEGGSALYSIYLSDGAGGFQSVPSLELNAEALAAYRADTTTYGTENVDYRVEAVFLDVYHNFLPCYYSTLAKWSGGTVYYYETDNYRPNGTPKSGAHTDTTSDKHLIPQVADVNDASYGRISGATVTAIGKQYLIADSSNGWKIGGRIDETNGTSKGIFANNAYITTLNIGGNLSGIGDYAFYGCTNLNSITTGNGINTLGNHAFDNCRNMRSVNIPVACNLQVIGAYTFKNCQALQTFTLPTSVTTIGDGAFKGCWNLETIDLGTSGEANGSLTNMGVYVFIDCQSLKYLNFPQGFSQSMEISSFEGCLSLQYITTLNSNFNIVPSTTCDYGWREFHVDQKDGSITKDMFYLEGPSSGVLHTTARENEVSYKYPSQDVYELTKKERGRADAGTQPTVTYQVDSNNVLTDTRFTGAATSLTFPEYIGPYHIEKIGDGAFQDQCSLVEVTIASTIESIGANAFKGCHNLKYVYFNTNIVEIGENAFQTQAVGTHNSNCGHYIGKDSDFDGDPTNDKDIALYAASEMTNSSNAPVVQLGFVGDISAISTPYQYAMRYEGRYNNGDQTTSFITYYSGWPTMLTIKFNMTDTVTHEGYSELVDFPTALSLASYANAEYLSDDKKKAAAKAISDKNNGIPLTEDAQIFTDSANKLTIPTGVDGIKDGLFDNLTSGLATLMDVEINGIKHIETGYDAGGNPDPAKSDFYGCANMGSLTLIGTEPKVIDDYAFADCTGIKAVAINSPVATIGEKAFAGLTDLETVTMLGSVEAIGEEAFLGDAKLTTVYVTDNIGSIADHAFMNCEALTNVTFVGEVGTLGIRPFAGCKTLSNVNFSGSNNYVTDNSIIFRLNSGIKTSVIELLEGRNTKVEASELADVTSLAEEAFMGSGVKSINLYDSHVAKIPTNCFANTKSLREVVLPSSATVASLTISDHAFEGSAVDEITGEGNVMLISAVATDGILTTDGDPAVASNSDGKAVTSNTSTGNNKYVTIYAPEGSALYEYASMYKFDVQARKETIYHTVSFRDSGTELASMSVEDGKAVDPYYIPTPLGKDGYVFGHWESSTSSTLDEIWEDTVFTAIYVTPGEDYGKYTVRFFYYDEKNDPYHLNAILLSTQYILPGEDAVAPNAPVMDGYSFKTWTAPYTNIQKDTDVYAAYDSGYKVVFTYVDPTTNETVQYQTITVESGANATLLVRDPVISGYTFEGWNGWSESGKNDLTNVTSDMHANGYFKKNSESSADIEGYYNVSYYVDGNLYMTTLVAAGSDASKVLGPDKTGYTFKGWSPSPTSVNSDMTVSALYEAKAADATDSKTYTLTVVNGSGSGSYTAGTQVVIVANDPASGQQFKTWTIDPDSTPIASKTVSATVVTMPAGNVTVTANFVASSTGGTGGTGTGTGTGTPNPQKPTTTPTGTTVVIDKNGLSNTGVVSAVVNGSTDNFIIKISETSAASEAVLKALLVDYSDISNLVYFPMDITLYDSTGTKKITDTTGLSVTITIPLPDSMIQYAGNNKVAAVSNGKLENLSPKFTTINGISCVTFTATHFSPYVVYVDTSALSGSTAAGGTTNGSTPGNIDTTPKTGDFLKPKYFLSVGLAAAAVFLFVKKDKKTLKKAKVRA